MFDDAVEIGVDREVQWVHRRQKEIERGNNYTSCSKLYIVRRELEYL